MNNKTQLPGGLPLPDAASLLVVPLGGTDRVGMNCTLIGHAGRWIMIDAGATFTGSDDNNAAAFGEYYGGQIQQIVPDFRLVRGLLPRLDGILVTHAHEDHIGALPSMHAFAKAWPGLDRIPLYAGDYARGVIRRKLEELGAKPSIGRLVANRTLKLGPFEITPIHATHSAPETFMLAIKSPVGTVVFGSDTKLDTGPLLGRTTDVDALERLGDKGVLAYFGDSTNATHSGRSTSEADVANNISRIMREHPGRVVVSTFASNLARIVGVTRAADRAGRMLASAGRTIANNLETAISVGMLDARRIAFADNWAVNTGRTRRGAFVCTGTQAEQGSALRRAAEDLEMGRRNRRGILLEAGDLVIHSARVIPGNEATVGAMFDMLRRHGVQVMDPSNAPLAIHASGHGKRGEIEDMYRMLRPQLAVPVHGHGQLTDAHADVARSMASVKQVGTPHEGEILRIDQAGMAVVGRIRTATLAVVTQGERFSGETRLVAWRDADEIDMLHSAPQREFSRPRRQPEQAEPAPSMGR